MYEEISTAGNASGKEGEVYLKSIMKPRLP
jgi:hypothetical protein